MATNNPPPREVFRVVSKAPVAPEMLSVLEKMVNDAFVMGQTAGRAEAVAQLARDLAASRKRTP